MPFPEYSRLLPSPRTSQSDDVELLTLEDRGLHSNTRITTIWQPSTEWLAESAVWKTLTLALVLSLAISAINLAFLSAWTTLSSSTTAPQSIVYPDAYIGLESVTPDPSRCLSRRTFLDTFFTYDTRKGPRTTLTHVHAPEDEVTLSFGGSIRAVMEVYVPDYGLENCTFIVHSSNTTHPGQGRSVAVYLLPAEKPGNDQNETFLDRLQFIPGRNSMSRPFYCPSRSHVHFELRCDEEDCIVQIPLQGVTSKSTAASSLPASSLSTVETGFRINQYEALDCIDGLGAEEVQM